SKPRHDCVGLIGKALQVLPGPGCFTVLFPPGQLDSQQPTKEYSAVAFQAIGEEVLDPGPLTLQAGQLEASLQVVQSGTNRLVFRVFRGPKRLTHGRSLQFKQRGVPGGGLNKGGSSVERRKNEKMAAVWHRNCFTQQERKI